MAAPAIPGPSTQAVSVTGGTQPFTTQWWNFFNNLLAYITTGPLGPVPLVGVIDGSNAAVGNVGEYRSVFVAAGAAIALTTGVDTQITTLTLPAGDWNLTGEFFATLTGATITNIKAAIAATVTTSPGAPADGIDEAAIHGISSASPVQASGGLFTRANITTSTTYRLVGFATFTGGTCAGYGALRARRVR